MTNQAYYPAEVKEISDEELISRLTPCGSKTPLTKEAILAMNQPLGGPKLTWEMFKASHTPLGGSLKENKETICPRCGNNSPVCSC